MLLMMPPKEENAMNTNESMNRAAKTAQFKFGLIAPVIQGLFPDASRTAFYKIGRAHV